MYRYCFTKSICYWNDSYCNDYYGWKCVQYNIIFYFPIPATETRRPNHTHGVLLTGFFKSQALQANLRSVPMWRRTSCLRASHGYSRGSAPEGNLTTVAYRCQTLVVWNNLEYYVVNRLYGGRDYMNEKLYFSPSIGSWSRPNLSVCLSAISKQKDVMPSTWTVFFRSTCLRAVYKLG